MTFSLIGRRVSDIWAEAFRYFSICAGRPLEMHENVMAIMSKVELLCGQVLHTIALSGYVDFAIFSIAVSNECGQKKL